MKQSHRYSQKFLRDRKILKKIFDSLYLDNAVVVEVGSGDGRLSEYLHPACRHLYCVEVDKRFCTHLEKKFSQHPKVTVVNADILHWPLSQLGQPVVLVGNSPYHISKQLIGYCIANRTFIQVAYLMFQREFADKLCAQETMTAYCPLSCFFQYYAKVQPLFDVPASCFWPPPRVVSRFVKIIFFASPAGKAINDDFLFALIDEAFAQRRKKIINSLASYPGIAGVLKKLDIDPNARAENISLADYIRLANTIYPFLGKNHRLKARFTAGKFLI